MSAPVSRPSALAAAGLQCGLQQPAKDQSLHQRLQQQQKQRGQQPECRPLRPAGDGGQLRRWRAAAARCQHQGIEEQGRAEAGQHCQQGRRPARAQGQGCAFAPEAGPQRETGEDSAPALQPARAAQGAPLPSVSASSAPRASAASRLKAASSARGRGQGGALAWAVSCVRGAVMRAIVLRRPAQGVPFSIILVYWAHRRGSIVWPNALAWNASTVLKPSWVRIPPSPLCARGQGVTCR